MTRELLAKLIEGKTPVEVMDLLMVAQDPVLQVGHGLDFTNVIPKTIPGAVRFYGFESMEDSRDTAKFSSWSVTFVNGSMNPMYIHTDKDLEEIEKKHGPGSSASVRNSDLFCVRDGRAVREQNHA